MKYLYLLLFISLMSSSACSDSSDSTPWLGDWKINNKNKGMSFSIKSTNESQLEIHYDEGVGINGIRINGEVTLIKNNIGFVNALVRGAECKLKLQLSKNNKKITLSNCELDSYDESGAAKVFVPRTQKLYYKASFNCSKVGTIVEIAICNSKIIAAADKKLGTVYKQLRKKLSSKNKKRLRREQRHWIKTRDWSCKKKEGKSLDYCLRKHYGKRLFSLNVLSNHKLWVSNSLNYSTFNKISSYKNKFDFMSNGLGLWLGGVMERQLTDTGTFEVSSHFNKNSYILTGPYNANPSAGHDPQSFNNKIFIEFSKNKGVWVALVDSGSNLVYTPKGKNIMDASNKLKLWVKDFDEPEVLDVF